MFKRTLLASAIALSCSVTALAEPPKNSPSDKTSQLGKASEWIGKDVKDEQGNSVGDLKDFAVNLKDATIPFAVIQLDGTLSSKSIAVPLSALTAVPGDTSTVTLAASESQWKAAKTFDKESWPMKATLVTGGKATAAKPVAARTTTPATPKESAKSTTYVKSGIEAERIDQHPEFVDLDRDGDGYLSATEVQPQRGLSRIWNSDTNQDKRIDKAEFAAFETMEQKTDEMDE